MGEYRNSASKSAGMVVWLTSTPAPIFPTLSAVRCGVKITLIFCSDRLTLTLSSLSGLALINVTQPDQLSIGTSSADINSSPTCKPAWSADPPSIIEPNTGFKAMLMGLIPNTCISDSGAAGSNCHFGISIERESSMPPVFTINSAMPPFSAM